MPPTALPVAFLSNILGKGPSAPRLQEYYTLGPVLGKGAFGTVYQAVDKKTGVAYACKSISKAKLVCKEDIEDVQRVSKQAILLNPTVASASVSTITASPVQGCPIEIIFSPRTPDHRTLSRRKWRYCILSVITLI